MKEFIISTNIYLKKDTSAFYHAAYKTQGIEGNPDYLNNLKNTYGKPESSDVEWYQKQEQQKLDHATSELKTILKKDLPKIFKKLKKDSLSICVVPRSKSESNYKDNQLLFKSTIQSVAKELDKFKDATDYIVRISNTKTTHLNDNTPNYNNDGEMPYVGITKKTCIINENIENKDILLIDDIYTAGVNIDEDVIQTLIDKGAKSVTFYAVGACGI